MRNRTALITGSTGLIGSRLAVLAPSDIDVLTLSRDADEIPPADIIIHAAGYATPALFMADPIGTIEINTEAVIRLLEKLNKGGTFLFCSSSEVYSGVKHEVSESDIGTTTPQHQRSCYIEGKRCGEAIVKAYRDQGVSAISARISTAYGPGTKKHDSRVINQFIEAALTKKRIEMKDRGEALRTFCYVDDTADMLWRIVRGGCHPVYNVGGTETATILELARMIALKTGAELIIPTSDTNFIGAPREVRMNLDCIRELGPFNLTTLSNGLDATIDYQRGLYA